MLTCNRLPLSDKNYFLNFSALISHMVNLDSYHPQKQNLLGALKHFEALKTKTWRTSDQENEG